MNDEHRVDMSNQGSIDLEEDPRNHRINKQSTNINITNRQRSLSPLVFQTNSSNIFGHKQNSIPRRKPSQYKEITETDLREITQAMNTAMGSGSLIMTYKYYI